MRISRGCYDKYHRCPGWAGGGFKYAKNPICDSGSLGAKVYMGRLWRFRPNRCPRCGTIALPWATRYLDPTWVLDRISWRIRNALYNWRRR